jgi:hypothetical protein
VSVVDVGSNRKLACPARARQRSPPVLQRTKGPSTIGPARASSCLHKPCGTHEDPHCSKLGMWVQTILSFAVVCRQRSRLIAFLSSVSRPTESVRAETSAPKHAPRGTQSPLHSMKPTTAVHQSVLIASKRLQVPHALSPVIPLHSVGPRPLFGTPSQPTHSLSRDGSSGCRHCPHKSSEKPPSGTPWQSLQLSSRLESPGRRQSPHKSSVCCPLICPLQSVHARLKSGSSEARHSPQRSYTAGPFGTPRQSVHD